MKFATAWWGVQILAETEEDKTLLAALVESLPSKASSSYEDGLLKTVTDPQFDDCWGFSEEEIKAAKLVIGFLR